MVDPSETEPLLPDKQTRPGEENPVAKKARWRSIRSVYFTNFLNAIGFSIVMSTLWPYLDRVGGTKSFLGYLVSAFSFGQLIGSPYFGYWANHWKYKYIFFLSGVLKVGGNLMYAFADSVGGRKDFFLLEARLLVGLGAGNMALCNAYVSQATTLDERTSSMAMLAATGGIGFIVGPLIGISFGSMKPGYQIGSLMLDYLTMPSICCCVLETINQLSIMFFFREQRGRSLTPIKNPENSSIQMEGMNKDIQKTDQRAVWMMMLLYFGTMIVLSVFETVGSPLTMDEYAWDSQQADIGNGLIAGGFGFICLVVFAVIKKLTTKFGERQMLIFGLIGTTVAMALLIPWGSARPQLWVKNDDDDDSTRRGCQASWCADVPKLPFAQFIVGNVIVAICYPICNVMEFALFSKILGPGPQGVMMGWLTASGCLARALGPLYITQLYADFGPQITFGVASGLCFLMVIVGMLNFKRFVPHQFYRMNGNQDQSKTKSVLLAH